MNDQHRIETAADNCEVLRARLARYEDGEGRPLLVGDVAQIVEELRYLSSLNGDGDSEAMTSAANALESQAREIERLKRDLEVPK